MFSYFYLAHYGSASAPPKKSKVLNDSTNKRKLRTSSPLKVPAKDLSKDHHHVVTNTKPLTGSGTTEPEVNKQLTGSGTTKPEVNKQLTESDVGLLQHKLKETQMAKDKLEKRMEPLEEGTTVSQNFQ